MKSSTSSDAPGAGSKIKLYLIGALVLLVLGAVLYFVGLQAGKAQLSAQAAKFGAERNGLQSQVKTAETARDDALNRLALTRARAALYRSAIDLDARNFGTANTHVQEAAASLAQSKQADIELLQKEVAATDLNVAVDLAGQRKKVLGFAEQLTALTPVEIPSTSASAAATASMPEDVQGAPSAP